MINLKTRGSVIGKLSAALLALTICTASVAEASLIGINFVGGKANNGAGGNGSGGDEGNLLLPTDSAGVMAQTNWNNAFGRSGGPQALVNDMGAASGAMVSWGGAPWTFNISASAAGDANAALMNGYLDTNNNSTTTVTVTGISYALYDVYVYFDGGSTGGRAGNYTANGATKQGNDVGNWPIAAGGGTFDDATTDMIGNYILFSGLTGDLTVTATPILLTDSVKRAPLNAIQIVRHIPEPGTLALFGLGLAGLGIARRKRMI